MGAANGLLPGQLDSPDRVVVAGKLLLAVFIRRAFTCAGVNLGSFSIKSAAAPLTTGVAILVPLSL